jgi:hypothetical protein
MEAHERISKCYRFTVQMKDGKAVGNNAKSLELLRQDIKAENVSQEHGKKKYVKLQGRGHRHGSRRFCQGLPLSLAERADVYVYDRY